MRIRSFVVNFLTNIKDIYFGKLFKKKERFKFNKDNLYAWMNLTKKERFKLSKLDSMNYLIERKNLLHQIRDEYKKTIKKV